MTLGTSIFLSTAVVSILVLFALTKSSWSWRKIAKWFGASILGILLLGAAIGLAIYWVNSRPKIQNELWGLTLNNSAEDVRFLKGPPHNSDFEIKDTARRYDSLYLYVEETSYSKDKIWRLIFFRDDTIQNIVCHWFGTPSVPSLQGIGTYSEMDDVEKKFGKPDSVSRSEDGKTRDWYYKRYNLSFSFERGRVRSYSMVHFLP
jgi:hypothetical protein